jgi:4,5-dihydroxyphthalate decarboxylase
VTSRSLSLALDMSDRTVALHLGLSQLPSDVRLEHVPQATDHRHERMLESLEWDICEFSLATYIAARHGGWPVRAVAIFPRRLFAISLLFVHRDAGITRPKHLIGRRVGIRSFHTTLCVWGLGDLASVYGVPLADVVWVTERSDPLPVRRPQDWRVEQIEHGDSLDAAFERGDLDAILVPRVPAAVRDGHAVPLFKHTGEAMQHYFHVTNAFPIMHTIVVRDDVLERHPELPTELCAAFEDAKRMGYSFYGDPNWCLLAEANEVLQSERAWLGDDPYRYGLEPNLSTVNRLIEYERMLGLIRGELAMESLFVPIAEMS